MFVSSPLHPVKVDNKEVPHQTFCTILTVCITLIDVLHVLFNANVNKIL